MIPSADKFVDQLKSIEWRKLTFGEFQVWLDQHYPGWAVVGGFSTVSIYDEEGKLYAWTVSAYNDGNLRIRGSLFHYDASH